LKSLITGGKEGEPVDFTKFVPNLIRQGYNGSNTDHQSIFWLYLSHPEKASEKKHLLCLGPDGLNCNDDSIGNIKVFTEADLMRFGKLLGNHGFGRLYKPLDLRRNCVVGR